MQMGGDHIDTMIIGIMGCGGIARAHVRALALIEPVKELVLYDVSAQSMAGLGQLWPRAVTSGRSVADLAAHSDAFIVCTPNNLHHPVIAQVLEYKQIPFVCEKPLASDYVAAQRIVHAAPAASIVSFNYRYNPLIQQICRTCRQNALGRLNYFAAEFNKDSAITRNHLTWRDLAQQRQSSGALGDLSCHLLDLFCVLACQKIAVDSVRVVKGTRIREKRDGMVEVDDHGYVFGQGEKGAFFKKSEAENRLGLHLNLVFEKGEINYSSKDENMLTISRFDRPGSQEIVCGAEKILHDPPRELPYWSDSFYYMLRQWCAVVSGVSDSRRLSLWPGLEAGLHIQEVMETF